MKAKIEVDVPEYQIGQEVNIYFKDTMQIKGITEKSNDVIKELQDIRREMLERHKCEYMCDRFSEDLSIIERHITELKGEQK